MMIMVFVSIIKMYVSMNKLYVYIYKYILSWMLCVGNMYNGILLFLNM